MKRIRYLRLDLVIINFLLLYFTINCFSYDSSVYGLNHQNTYNLYRNIEIIVVTLIFLLVTPIYHVQEMDIFKKKNSDEMEIDTNVTDEEIFFKIVKHTVNLEKKSLLITGIIFTLYFIINILTKPLNIVFNKDVLYIACIMGYAIHNLIFIIVFIICGEKQKRLEDLP